MLGRPNHPALIPDQWIQSLLGGKSIVMKIAGYGVFGTPVVLDSEVKSVGKIPNEEDVKSWPKK